MCTMLAEKELPVPPPAPAYCQELEYLYARRSAIDGLIKSLEEYASCAVAVADESKRHTA